MCDIVIVRMVSDLLFDYIIMDVKLSVFEFIFGLFLKMCFVDVVGEVMAVFSKCMEEVESEVRVVVSVSSMSVYWDIFGVFIKKGGLCDVFFVEVEMNLGLDVV